MKKGPPLQGREGYPSQSGNNAGGIEDLIKQPRIRNSRARQLQSVINNGR